MGIQTLIFINAVSAVEISQLSGMVLIPGIGVNIGNVVEEILPIVGLSTVVISSAIDHKGRVYKTTVNAKLCNHFAVADRKLAFIVRTAGHMAYLVGSSSAPYPTINTTDSFPGTATGESGCDLTIEYTDIHGILPIIG